MLSAFCFLKKVFYVFLTAADFLRLLTSPGYSVSLCFVSPEENILQNGETQQPWLWSKLLKQGRSYSLGTWAGEWEIEHNRNVKGVLSKMNVPLLVQEVHRLLGTHSIWPVDAWKEKRKPCDEWCMVQAKLRGLVGPRLLNLEKIPARHGLIPENLCQKR